MRFIIPILCAALVGLGVPGLAMATPKAVPQAPVWEFEPVPEGQQLTHEFVIANQGDTPLTILSVIPP